MKQSDTGAFSLSTVMDDAFKNDMPIFVIIELTTRCNWRCHHCYLPEHEKKGLSTNELKNVIDELREFGVHQIAFTGGELFMRKDALDIIEYARNKYFRVSILSNASLITEKIARKLSELYITDFSSTIFSMLPDVHDSITGIKGSHRAAMRGIKRLQEQGISIELKSPILKQNKDSFESVYAYCLENNFSYMSSTCIFPRIDGNYAPLRYSLNDDELEKAIAISDRIMNYTAREFLTENMCNILKTSFAISATGDIFPCNSFFLKMGNILEETIVEIWNKPKYLEVRNLKNKNLTNCLDCQLVSVCDRCPATSYSEGRGFYGCSSIAKNIAKARYISTKKEKIYDN
ncbi:radical SAM/SPASM domain-containing protein [Streptococcus ruminantium]|uniref:radical SAM/SPASM domain-containing protein n=2 Tax=Streptococcus ruminantium TaxID=1917441 RepID=UPI0012DF0D32|nr:radical SAM protein [Streptococcus ruminantium]